MSYVCAYSSVQLDKSRVEKEFTLFCYLRARTALSYSAMQLALHGLAATLHNGLLAAVQRSAEHVAGRIITITHTSITIINFSVQLHSMHNNACIVKFRCSSTIGLFTRHMQNNNQKHFSVKCLAA